MVCASTEYPGAARTATPWFNWAGLAGGPVAEYHEPQSLTDLVTIVRSAQAAGRRVRAVGTGWAFEDIAYSPDVMVSLVELDGVLDYITSSTSGALLPPALGASRRLVHVEAGIKIAKLNDELEDRGLAMPTLGGANGQSLVGAMATSTHGADLEQPPLCDLVHAVHLVGVGGQEYWIERRRDPITANARLGRALPCPDTIVVRDDDVLNAVVVGLGRFGIIYSVVIEAVASYTLVRQRCRFPLSDMTDLLRRGVANGTFLDPLLAALPDPPPEFNAQAHRGRPRAIELVLDSRNPDNAHVVRRWLASGPPIDMTFEQNPLCSLQPGFLLGAGATALVALGMNPVAVNNPLVLFDPWRPSRLAAKHVELIAAMDDLLLPPGEALALVCNAMWELDLKKVNDLLALAVYHSQFKTQRGPSYAVMTGDPAFASSSCYRANSCEVIFDAADSRYLDLVDQIASVANKIEQAGYISLRYSKRSNALLSMHNVASDHAVSIEVSTLKGLRGSANWIDLVLAMATGLGGRAHWGQQNRPLPEQVEASYGHSLTVWREILGTFAAGQDVFSTPFTIARGLEPKGKRSIGIVGTASQLASGGLIAPSMLLLS